ncbi:beta-galactosidase-1-like protein 2 [Centruroides sculpturatus]|uniref:beta-galactosidase-1-like protein 2 n=1 Tax=Centruroides sculpturatus TaxID=218467 RepID=UPI000C6CE788|nr:beta-galactosidase-1-like protein 2 [Centruroides sculpturatus]XP_023243974.1 beta-galactosidase-1-like protein 2 [Centruroides sculpturatus]
MSRDRLPTLYEIYSHGGYRSGLEARENSFFLNDKPFQIISGTLHYFRVVPEYWDDRLRKMKACGLNSVDIYVPWNLHEELPGKFNFERGICDLPAFLSAVKSADMFVVFRPGPYICAEWDFGGLPGWLLKDKNMAVRSNYPPYKLAVKRYFTRLAEVVRDFLFGANFGPIIAIQIENEFNEFGNANENPDDLQYMSFLKNTLEELGLKELFFTSDAVSQMNSPFTLPDVLMTANFQIRVEEELSALKKLQPNKPLYVAEFWSGWYDHWTEKHNTFSVEEYEKNLKIILENKASLNIYVFHGGTNFGFYNGANEGFPNPECAYSPTVTSYDYDAPLTESGDYTPKYHVTKKIISEMSIKNFTCFVPPLPLESQKMKILDVGLSGVLHLGDILEFIKGIKMKKVRPMEFLDVYDGSGQNFGMTLYRTKIAEGGKLSFPNGMADRAIILVDNRKVVVWDWKQNTREIRIPHLENGDHCLDILVENMGRVNYGVPLKLNSQRKGLWNPVLLEEKELRNWSVYPLQFDEKFINMISCSIWKKECAPPCLYKVELHLDSEPRDSFLFSKTWKKGVVFVNGFNLGRYWNVGPQQTLYLPAPLLKVGRNTIYIFEMHNKILSIDFLDKPILNQSC